MWFAVGSFNAAQRSCDRDVVAGSACRLVPERFTRIVFDGTPGACAVVCISLVACIESAVLRAIWERHAKRCGVALEQCSLERLCACESPIIAAACLLLKFVECSTQPASKLSKDGMCRAAFGGS